MSGESLHRENPTGRFSGRADAYARYRPDYPADALQAVAGGLGCAPEPIAADLGAGTGISSWQLAERGIFVYALEPNEEMRLRMLPHPRIVPIDARAESIPLEDSSIDLVTAFQAFHWFDPARALPEIARVLRPRGRLALLWNERDDERDLFTERWRVLARRASGDHPAESRMDHSRALYESALFVNVRRLSFQHEQALDWDGVIGRLASTSYIPSSGPAWE
ncbi:MAG TPA: class I SAM-dependent methyltransferase, partial [Thermoanaerobaculia bacterium]|nr:class I SAM-dependent methyltransferase [Thermoanaerobaculia bacterium]